MNDDLLGGLDYETFFRDYWQKRPLLVRNALPGFSGLIDPEALFKLSTSEEALSRLVFQQDRIWRLEHGPFKRKRFQLADLDNAWTLLVQELNHHLHGAEQFLQRFDFIPHARLDDLMVSYAPAGGGVGPHFDSYDVFLIQGMGSRRWQISAQKDLELMDGLPLKILRNFIPEMEWILTPGDLLYLPPHYAHNGIAMDECMTYSVGFRAPSTQEMATQFLVYMQDKLDLPGQYQDPDLAWQTHSGEIAEGMITKIAGMIGQIQWDRADIADFIGRYLTEPKAHVFFRPPVRPLSMAAFCKQVASCGLRLAPQSQLLFHGERYYLNGMPFDVPMRERLQIMADTRKIAPEQFDVASISQFYQGYLDGYFLIDKKNI